MRKRGHTKIVTMTHDIILSLTTIPSRAPHLGQFLNSILAQSLSPVRIELNVPWHYSMRDLGQIDVDMIPSDFDVHRCDDAGPATKILPTLKRHAATNAMIVYCDDDRIYHPDWLARLVETADRHPNCAISDECNSLAAIGHKFRHPVKDWRYRLKRAASFGFYAPYIANRATDWDVAEGFGGVLVKPSFFSASVFDVPRDVWAVDDIWLSANLLANGADIIWTQRKNSERSKSLRVDGQNLGREDDALTMATIDGLDRVATDYRAVKFCQDQLKVWQNRSLDPA